MENKVIIISGPTSSGKTMTAIESSIRLKSQSIETAIVNFDSLLFYRGLNIGTAKPTTEELEAVEHHLINISPPESNFNASHYTQLATQKIEQLHQQGKVVFLVGGSAFYLRALLKGMYEQDNKKSDTQQNQELNRIKKEVNSLYQEKGIAPIRKELESVDNESFTQLHENDHYRNIRALEHYRITGQKISDQKKRMDNLNPYDFSNHIHSLWNIYHIYLDLPKDEHYPLITSRTQQMINDGLIEEVRGLLESGLTGEEKSMKSIGYKETIQYIRGEFSSLEDYMERISISTRQLAKSQRTFFKKVTPKLHFHPLENKEEIQSSILNFIKTN